MNRIRRIFCGLGCDVAFTGAVAWLGQRYIAGFDIRGPFLLMSPLYAGALFFGIGFLRFMKATKSDGEPNGSDAQLIQSTALEFGFPPVSAMRQRMGEDLRIVILTEDGDDKSLPKGWDKFTIDAKRFAVIRALADPKKKGFAGFIQSLPWHAVRSAAMILTGLNLWLILACHGLGAAWFAVMAFYHQPKIVSKLDIAALKVMRDLDAAIAFVKSDPASDTPLADCDQRLAALRVAAARMGIA